MWTHCGYLTHVKSHGVCPGLTGLFHLAQSPHGSSCGTVAIPFPLRTNNTPLYIYSIVLAAGLKCSQDDLKQEGGKTVGID